MTDVIVTRKDNFVTLHKGNRKVTFDITAMNQIPELMDMLIYMKKIMGEYK